MLLIEREGHSTECPSLVLLNQVNHYEQYELLRGRGQTHLQQEIHRD